MRNTALQSDKVNPADIILEAAVNRFSEYGYNKTTVAEIAKDAGMSAANIYRYYKNKEEIAAACAKDCMCERLDILKSVIRDTTLTAAEKLEKYVLGTLQASQEMFLENKKIDEVVMEITKNRSDLVHNKINNETALITEIIAYGNQTGEFDVDDIIDTAAAIHSMLVLFDVPVFMHLFTKEEFEKKAHAVIKLLASGLNKKN
jgi:AcrR family transcriptional regulator